MKINSRTNEDATTIAELENRLESIATYLINQDAETMRLNQRILNLEMVIAKMQHQLQGQQPVQYAAPTGMTIQNGQIHITTKP